MPMPDIQLYPHNTNLIKMWKIPSFFNARQVTLTDNPQMKKKQIKETKNFQSNSNLIRKSFQVYCCKSGNAIFALRVTLIYAYTVPLRKTKQETRAEVILMGKLKADMDFLGRH